MRPRLKNSTLYVPSAEGVYIISNHGTLTLKGKQIYQWLDRIAPYLDGKRTLDEIVGGLSNDRRELVTGLVGALFDKGFIKDVTGELPHTLDAEVTAAYASEIAFVDYYVDSAAHRFERFRDSRVLALGSGLTLTALVQANLHSGLIQVHVAPTAECAVNSARHAEYLELARRRDRRQSLVERPASAWPDERAAIEAALEPFDIVIHVSDRPMFGRARALNRAGVEQGKRVIQALVEGDRAWLGPLVGAKDGGACWECAWLRRLGHRAPDAAAFTDHPEAPVSEFLAGPTAAIIANQLSFEIFKHVTGGGPLETADTLIELDLETLESKGHAVTRHPLCEAHGPVAAPSEAEFLDAIRGRERGPAGDAEAFSKQAARLFDDVTGILGSLGEDDFEQLPLKIARAEVSNPLAARGLGSRNAAIGVATDFALARQRATQRACELYAAGIVDHRRTHADRVWGYDLVSGAARLLRAGSVFPVLENAAASHDTAPGLASGFSWSEAVVRGLLAQCARLTIAELERAATPFPLIDMDAIPRLGNTARYGRYLNIAGESLAVYDVTGALEVPTLAACLGEQTVCYVANLDLPQALESAFEHAIQAYQARANQQPAYAPREVPPLPRDRRGSAVAARRGAASLAWPQQQEILVRQLVRAGWRPVVALLDHDPVVETVLPYIVHVVLVPEGSA